MEFIEYSVEYKENNHYNRKQNPKDSERVERKKALKKFKKLKQQNEDKSTEVETNPSANLYRSSADIAYTRLKADENFSLIRNIVMKKGHKMIRLDLQQENESDDDNKTNSDEMKIVAGLPKKKKAKYMKEYQAFLEKQTPKTCRICGHLFEANDQQLCEEPWTNDSMESILHHWLKHRDSEMANVYYDGDIDGILELEETKIEEFFKYIKEIHGKKTAR